MKIMSNRVGMNEVVETAVTLFEKSELSVNACKKIINACRDSLCRLMGIDMKLSSIFMKIIVEIV